MRIVNYALMSSLFSMCSLPLITTILSTVPTAVYAANGNGVMG